MRQISNSTRHSSNNKCLRTPHRLLLDLHLRLLSVTQLPTAAWEANDIFSTRALLYLRLDHFYPALSVACLPTTRDFPLFDIPLFGIPQYLSTKTETEAKRTK